MSNQAAVCITPVQQEELLNRLDALAGQNRELNAQNVQILEQQEALLARINELEEILKARAVPANEHEKLYAVFMVDMDDHDLNEKGLVKLMYNTAPISLQDNHGRQRQLNKILHRNCDAFKIDFAFAVLSPKGFVDGYKEYLKTLDNDWYQNYIHGYTGTVHYFNSKTNKREEIKDHIYKKVSPREVFLEYYRQYVLECQANGVSVPTEINIRE